MNPQGRPSAEGLSRTDVSVIVPVFNAGPFLHDCLESLATQSMASIEVLCVNDGSTDASPEILATYAERDRRFRILETSNQGQAVARNLAISRASGSTSLSWMQTIGHI